MRIARERHVRVAVQKVSYDIVLTATSEVGVAKLTGLGQLIDPPTRAPLKELGPVDLTVWGSTTEPLRMFAKTWPAQFDYVSGDYFGVAAAGEARFDVFLSPDRFMRLLDLAHGSRRGVILIRCDQSDDGRVDLVRELEISAARG